MSKYLNKLTVPIALAVALLWGASPARAGLTLTLTDEKTGATATYNGSGGLVSTPGFVTVGGFTVSVSGTSTAPANNPADVQQATVSFSYSGTGADKLDVTIQDNTFTGYGGLPVALSGSISTTQVASGVSGTSNAFYTDNLGTTTTSKVTETGPINAPQGVGTGSSKTLFSGSSSTFTLGSSLVIAVSGSSNIRSNFTVDAQATPLPAPPGVVLALSGLPVLGLGYWVRRRKQA